MPPRPTVLLAYEFGSGLGHLQRLIAVARGLADAARCVFAVPDVPLAAPLLGRAFGPAAELHAGVVWNAPRDPAARKVPTHTLADVLALFRFADADLLGPKLDHWRSLLDDLRPDLIVSDFAPTLRLLTEGDVPTIVVGNGYTVPPAGCDLVPLRPWQTDVPASSRAAEQRILSRVNRVRQAAAKAPIPFLSNLFGGERSFACTITEFDPYARLRRDPVTWPFNVPVIEPGPTARSRSGPELFVYMAASHPSFAPLLSALNRLGRATQLYVADQDPQAVARRCKPHIGILTKPADFAAVLPQTRLLVHHAGLGTAYAGLVAGTPQFMLPLNLEHLITARSLIETGVAQGFSANVNPTTEQMEAAILALLAGEASTEHARRVAQAVNARRVPDPTTPVLRACRALLPSDAA